MSAIIKNELYSGSQGKGIPAKGSQAWFSLSSLWSKERFWGPLLLTSFE